MNTSRRGVELIASFEGFIGTPYRDAVGVWTIGFGHTGPDVFKLGTLTRQQGLDLLARDLPRYEAAVNALINAGAEFTQGQYDALVSLVYNCGPGAVSGGIRRYALTHNNAAIPGVMLQFVHAGGRVLPGLVRRRQAEVALFRSAAPAPVDGLSFLTEHERVLCREYDRLKRARRDAARRRVLRGEMTAQRKRIWRAAQGPGGWDRADRRERYHSLLARTS